MITFEVRWHGAVYYFAVSETDCRIRVLYPHEIAGQRPQLIPHEVVCDAVRIVAAGQHFTSKCG